MFNKVRALDKAGRKDDAGQLCLEILARYPGNKKALDFLVNAAGGNAASRAANATLFKAMASFKAGRYADARKGAEAVRKVAPNHPEVLNLLGGSLIKLDRQEEALEFCRKAVAQQPRNTQYNQNLAKALIATGRVEEGLKYSRALAEAAPRDSMAQQLLASTLRSSGDSKGAEGVIERALKHLPNDIDLLESYSLSKRYDSVADPVIGRMESLLGSDKLGPVAQRKLAFALSRAYESCGEIEKTAEVLKTANALRSRELNYHPEKDRAHFRALRQHFNVPLEPLQPDDAGPTPIFIVGMPRSGTSLLEQILASHSAVFGAGELTWWNRAARPVLREQTPSEGPPIDAAGLAKIRADYQTVLHKMSGGASHVTDKMPTNFQWIGLIAAAFPEAPILHIRRDARAICWSIYKNYFGGHGLGFAYGADHLLAYHRDYLDIMDFWDALLPGRVTHIDYEAITEDQEGQTRAILDFCGLDWEPGVLDFHKNKRAVNTVSAMQVRQKIYKGSSEAWKPFAPFVPELFDSLPES